MSNIGIIAGGGKLPITIGSNLIKKKYNICYFVIEEFFNTNHHKALDVTIINLNSAKNIINSLKSKNINSIKNVYKFMGKAYHNDHLVAESEFSAMITSK